MSEIDYPYEFDEEKRKKAKVYSKQKLLTGFLQGTVITILTLVAIYLTGFSKILEENVMNLLSGTFLQNYWIAVALFIFLFITIIYIVGLPISYYSGHMIEHKYGLSNQDKLGWAKDQLKSFIVMQIFGVPLITGIFYLGSSYPQYWWLYAGLIYFAILGVLSNISHLLLLPLFYEIEELKDEDLGERLIEIAEENGVPEVEKVMVVKAGEKTEKANAAFAGMGKTKRLYLFDTLLDKFHDKEIESVVAHEMGHYVNKDVLRLILINGLTVFPIFFVAGKLFNIWGSFSSIYHLPLFLLIIYALYSLIDPITMAYSRIRERKADLFSLDIVKDPDAVVSTFKRLSDIDLAELDPRDIIEVLFYSHPPPKKRIQMAKRYKKEE